MRYDIADATRDTAVSHNRTDPSSSYPRTKPPADQPYQLPYSPSWWAAIRAASDQDMSCPAKRGASWFAMNQMAAAEENDKSTEMEMASPGVWLYHFTRPRNGSAT